MADQDFNIKVVTTANTAGVQQTSAAFDQLQAKIKATQQAAAAPVSGGAESFGRDIGRLIGLGAGAAAYKFIDTLRQSAGEIEKITLELQKQGAQVVENAQKFSEMAKFATRTSDVIRIGEGALKGVETAHKNLLDISQKELTVWQKIADIWAAGFKDKGPIAQALELQQAQAQQNYQMERTNAINEITAAQRTRDDLATKGYAEKVEYLTNKIRQQQDIQKRVGVSNVEDYLKAGKEAENYGAILENVNNERKQEIAGAGERTKMILKNEELARQARKYGHEDEAQKYDVATRFLKYYSTAQEKEEYFQLSGQAEAAARQKKNQEALDKELERQRTLTVDQQEAEAGRLPAEKMPEKPAEKTQEQPQAKPSAAPTPSPDVVTAIHELGDKFDRYWS